MKIFNFTNYAIISRQRSLLSNFPNKNDYMKTNEKRLGCKNILIPYEMAKNLGQSRDVQISKAMTWLLRHGAEKEGLPMRNDGFVKITDLLTHRTMRSTSLAEIQQIVESSTKQRFKIEMFEGEHYIRANQGHSLKNVEVDMAEISGNDNIDQCIHGTYFKCWDSIKKDGLSRMNRQHIHFSEDFPGSKNVISGMRGNCQIAIYIDVKKVLADGLRLFRSSNNVILCPGNEAGFLEPKYFLSVEDLIKGRRFLMSNEMLLQGFK